MDEGLMRLVDALNNDPPYDPRCERLETAVKAVWLLYRRAKWDLLAVMGIPRKEFEPVFEMYDLLLDHHYLNDAEATNLLRYARGVRPGSAIRLLSAAYWLIGKYRQRKLTYYGLQVKGPSNR